MKTGEKYAWQVSMEQGRWLQSVPFKTCQKETSEIASSVSDGASPLVNSLRTSNFESSQKVLGKEEVGVQRS